MPENVTIVRVSEETNFDDNGKPVAQVRVAFKVGQDGPFYKVYDRGAFSSDHARRDLDEFARELRTLRGL
ncbi:MAG: hypothetical protein LC750_16705 [Actinobacteria bacterium]|nr:hypothetical protein [Actinomycetota bacterium]